MGLPVKLLVRLLIPSRSTSLPACLMLPARAASDVGALEGCVKSMQARCGRHRMVAGARQQCLVLKRVHMHMHGSVWVGVRSV